MKKSEKSKQGLSTLAVHAGSEPPGIYGPGTTPIYQTSTFQLNDEVYKGMVGGHPRDVLIYSRYDNPTIRAVERKIAALEDSEDALVFASGMGAISSALEAFLKTGDRLVISTALYGLTRHLVVNRLPALGIEVEFVDGKDNNAWKKALSKPVKVVYCEGISNPLLELVDLEVVANFAHRAGAITMIDNTFATPVNSRPLEQGFDIVIHSASKYIGGHTDLICGAVAGKKAFIDKVWDRRLVGGACMDPHAAYLLERGLKTLALRVERHNQNALMVAKYLAENPKVTWIAYPGLESFPQHDLAKRQLDGFGGVVSFAVESKDAGIAAMRRLKVIREATSLGGVESVVSMPVNTSHSRLNEQELASAGIRPGTLRLSVGIEEVSDLIEDLKQAL